MIWLPVTLVCAFSLAVRDTIIKTLAQRGDDIFVVMAGFGFFSGLAALIYQLIFGDPQFQRLANPEALSSLAVMLPLEVVAFALYYKAITLSPLSVTAPFITFTPVAAPFFSWLIMGEPVSPAAYGGILLVVLGSYSLFFRSPRQLLEPFKSFLSEKGSIMMLVTALLYSVTSVMGRKLALNLGQDTISAVYPLLNALGLNAILLALGRLRRSRMKTASFGLFAGGVAAGALMVVTHFFAISLVNAAYMVSVKRSSALFSFILAVIFFREKRWLPRLAGTLIMGAGLAVVVLQS